MQTLRQTRALERPHERQARHVVSMAEVHVRVRVECAVSEEAGRVSDRLWQLADRVFEVVGPIIAVLLFVVVVVPMVLWLRLWYRLTGRNPDDVLRPGPNWGSW